MFKWITAVALMVTALPVQAAWEREVEVRIEPSVMFLMRHDATNTALGGRAALAYGILDWLEVETALGCQQGRSLLERGYAYEGDVGELFYDVSLCSVGPSLRLGWGYDVHIEWSGGLSYALEYQSERRLGAHEGFLLAELDAQSVHRLVADVGGGVSFRPLPPMTLGVRGLHRRGIAGDPFRAVELSIFASFGWYP